MKRLRSLVAAGVLLGAALPTFAMADEILDAIEAARAAYEAGNIQSTMEELAYAQQLVREMKTAGLTELLPDAPEGWTREINTDMGAAMAMFGGGVGAEATYARGNESFNLTLMADNPMVQAFAGMLGNGGLLDAGKSVDVGSETFLDQDGELTGLVDNRILVQASGAPLERMMPVLGAVDFTAMKEFGG